MVWICLVPEVVRNQSFTFFLMKFKDARYKCCTQKLLCDDGEIRELKVAKSFFIRQYYSPCYQENQAQR